MTVKRSNWDGEGVTKPELQTCHILFQQDDKETYIKTLLTTVTAK